MENGGNAKVNAMFEARLPIINEKPNNCAKGSTRERFIRDKYERRRYYDASNVSLQLKPSSPKKKDEKRPNQQRHQKPLPRNKCRDDNPTIPNTEKSNRANKLFESFDSSLVDPVKVAIVNDDGDCFSDNSSFASDVSNHNQRRSATKHRVKLTDMDFAPAFEPFVTNDAFSKVGEYFSDMEIDTSERGRKGRPSRSILNQDWKKRSATTMVPCYNLGVSQVKQWGKSVEEDNFSSNEFTVDEDDDSFDKQQIFSYIKDESQMTEEEKKNAKTERKRIRRQKRAQAFFEGDSDLDLIEVADEGTLQQKVHKKKKWAEHCLDDSDSEKSKEKQARPQSQVKKRAPNDDSSKHSKKGLLGNHHAKYASERQLDQTTSSVSLASNHTNESGQSKTSVPDNDNERADSTSANSSPTSVVDTNRDRVNRQKGSSPQRNQNVDRKSRSRDKNVVEGSSSQKGCSPTRSHRGRNKLMTPTVDESGNLISLKHSLKDKPESNVSDGNSLTIKTRDRSSSKTRSCHRSRSRSKNRSSSGIHNQNENIFSYEGKKLLGEENPFESSDTHLDEIIDQTDSRMKSSVLEKNPIKRSTKLQQSVIDSELPPQNQREARFVLGQTKPLQEKSRKGSLKDILPSNMVQGSETFTKTNLESLPPPNDIGVTPVSFFANHRARRETISCVSQSIPSRDEKGVTSSCTELERARKALRRNSSLDLYGSNHSNSGSGVDNFRDTPNSSKTKGKRPGLGERSSSFVVSKSGSSKNLFSKSLLEPKFISKESRNIHKSTKC